MSDPSLLHDFLFLCRFDLNVWRVERAHPSVPFTDAAGRKRFVRPDLVVKYRRDMVPAVGMPHLLCQVRRSEDLRGDWRNLRRRIRAQRDYARTLGWDFRILTELEIRTPYLANARVLAPYLRRPRNLANEDLLLRWTEEFQEADPETVLAAAARDRDHKAELIPSLWRLIATNRISCDLTRALTMASPIWTADAEGSNPVGQVYPPVSKW